MDSIFNKTECQQCKLASVCIAACLNRDEVRQVESIIHSRRPLNNGEYLYWQEDRAKSIYIVKSGSFRSVTLDLSGAEQTVNFYLPGDVIGLEALQSGSYSFSTIALETAAVCELPLVLLNDMCSKIPKVQGRLMHMIGTQLAFHYEHMRLLRAQTANEKMTGFLLMLSKRYSALGYSSTEFNLSMPRQDVASFLSMTVETVSRQISKLRTEGLISVNRRNIHINRLDSLRAES